MSSPEKLLKLMREETRSVRELQIAEATYALLAEKGYHACSMLAIAKKASASNQTLYRWYGDKAGLIRSLVAHNASEISELLKADLKQGRTGIGTLRRVGPRLLGMLLSERAILLNRAAASDPSGEVGRALTEAGRNAVAPLLGRVLKAARDNDELHYGNLNECIELYLSLLVGDLQIRRVIQAIPEPKPQWVRKRAERALDRLLLILAAE